MRWFIQRACTNGEGSPSGTSGLASSIVVGCTRHPCTWPQLAASTPLTGSVATYESAEMTCTTASTRRSVSPILTSAPENVCRAWSVTLTCVVPATKPPAAVASSSNTYCWNSVKPVPSWPHERPHELVADLGRRRVPPPPESGANHLPRTWNRPRVSSQVILPVRTLGSRCRRLRSHSFVGTLSDRQRARARGVAVVGPPEDQCAVRSPVRRAPPCGYGGRHRRTGERKTGG